MRSAIISLHEVRVCFLLFTILVPPIAGQCPFGWQSYLVNNILQTCNTISGPFCPAPYTCVSNFCCQQLGTGGTGGNGVTVSSGQCPNSGLAYVINGALQSCSQLQQCPNGYTCISNIQGAATGICCTNAQCNSGQAPYIASGVGLSCQVGSVCPNSYTCVSTTGTTLGYCCSSFSSTSGYCPTGAAFLQINGQPQTCLVNSNVCPTDFVCLTGSGTTVAYCCYRNTGIAASCTTGSIYTLNGYTPMCSFGLTNSCPSGYFCQTVIGTAGFCCSGTSGITAQCSNGGAVYYVNGSPQTCTINGFNTCVSNYVCVQGVGTTVGYCCSATSSIQQCSNGGTVQYVNGVPQTCVINFSSCQFGFTCVQGVSTTLAYCCSGTTSISMCSNGGTVNYINGVPQSCVLNSAFTCFSGYTCVQGIGTSTAYCCSITGLNAQCANGGSPYLINGSPQVCVLGGINQCISLSYTCTQGLGTASAYCCTNTGSTSLCSNGGTPNYINGQPQACVLGSANACIFSYTCVQSLGTIAAYCCTGTSSSALCSNGGSPYNPNGVPQTCTIGAINVCINGYTCVQGVNTITAYCCTGTASTTCPNGGTLYTVNGIARTCVLNTINACQVGYTCYQGIGSTTAYCCSDTSQSIVCSNGGTALTVNGQVQLCTIGVTVCSTGYTCVQGIGTANTYCCSGGTSPSICSNGGAILSVNGIFQTCVLGSACQTGYTCVQGTGTTTAYCCSGSSSTFCPFGGSPLLLNGVAQTCTAATQANCGTGYACQVFNTVSGYCCTGTSNLNAGCPSNLAAELLNGSPRICLPNTIGQCSTAYTCQFSPTFGRYQCCTGTSTTATRCPSGEQPYLPETGATPLQCFGSQCPYGYTCTATASGLSLCCPQPSYACQLTYSAGTTCSGGSSGQRYHYDKTTRTCTQFTFGGCGGNANNFESSAACTTFCSSAAFCRYTYPITLGNTFAPQQCSGSTCTAGSVCANSYGGNTAILICCPTREFACKQSLDTGFSCTGSTTTSTQYYYDYSLKQCRQLSYLGCGGNSNRFGSIADCNAFCRAEYMCLAGSALPSTTDIFTPTSCSISTPCPGGYNCENSIRCCPSQTSVCNLPVQIGLTCTGSLPSTRWYYNAASLSCFSFTYSGCNGNDNNFSSDTDCRTLCITAGTGSNTGSSGGGGISGSTSDCRSNTPPYRDANNRLFVCTYPGATSSDCPPGYRCLPSPVTAIPVCCL